MKVFLFILLLLKCIISKVDIKEKFKDLVDLYIGFFYTTFKDMFIGTYPKYRITCADSKFLSILPNNETIYTDTYASLYNNTVTGITDFTFKINSLRSVRHKDALFEFKLNPLTFGYDENKGVFNLQNITVTNIQLDKTYDISCSNYFIDFQQDKGELFSHFLSNKISQITNDFLENNNLVFFEFRDVMQRIMDYFDNNELNYTYGNVTVLKYDNFSYTTKGNKYLREERKLSFRFFDLTFNLTLKYNGVEEKYDNVYFTFLDSDESVIFSKDNFTLFETYSISPTEMGQERVDCMYYSFIKYFNEQREIYYK